MGGFQFQQPIRQKLLSKQQRGPYPNWVEKEKVALSHFTSFNSPAHSFSLKLPRVLFSQALLTHLPGHHTVLNHHLDTICYLKAVTFTSWLVKWLITEQQTPRLYSFMNHFLKSRYTNKRCITLKCQQQYHMLTVHNNIRLSSYCTLGRLYSTKKH